MDRFIAPALSLLIFSAAAQPDSAKMYRWIDEEGNTQYSDKISTEAVRRPHSTISKGGRTIGTTGAARTEEEYARDLELKRLQAEQHKELQRQQAKEQVLLRTFRTEDDIILSRDGTLSTYDTQIHIVYENIQRLKKRLAQLQQYAAKLERQGKQVDSKTRQGIESTHQEIKSNYEFILRQEHDKERIENKYANDLRRFRRLTEIKNINVVRIKTIDSAGNTNMLVETAIRCEDDAHCESLWDKALKYGKAHASTPVYTDSERIFMTMPAVAISDISITVSRIRPDKEGKEVIFMDVQCKKNIAHETWCRTPEAQKIRDGFKPAVAQ
jgi:hypothetical protein